MWRNRKLIRVLHNSLLLGRVKSLMQLLICPTKQMQSTTHLNDLDADSDEIRVPPIVNIPGYLKKATGFFIYSVKSDKGKDIKILTTNTHSNSQCLLY